MLTLRSKQNETLRRCSRPSVQIHRVWLAVQASSTARWGPTQWPAHAVICACSLTLGQSRPTLNTPWAARFLLRPSFRGSGILTNGAGGRSAPAFVHCGHSSDGLLIRRSTHPRTGHVVAQEVVAAIIHEQALAAHAQYSVLDASGRHGYHRVRRTHVRHLAARPSCPAPH